ncbi:hypothetical protein C8Q75DRAFT_736189 [Abortiporus biennis]|nr:hypothetical protein C8Q75DRAFT_736189 [Abortiporus biennis]
MAITLSSINEKIRVKPVFEVLVVPKPLLRFPYKSLEEQLMLLIPQIEDKTCKEGEYQDHFDRCICQELEGPDGLPFFYLDLKELPDRELWIRVTLGVDWFLYLHSKLLPSHSSYPMSYSIINLPPHLYYCTANLILVGIMPGPTEQDLKKVAPEAFQKDGFQVWTDAEHRKLQKEYLECSSATVRNVFVKKYATHWSELS